MTKAHLLQFCLAKTSLNTMLLSLLGPADGYII